MRGRKAWSVYGFNGRANGFNPTSLFTGGFTGYAIDFTDISTLYQDDARTLAAVEGQTIGFVQDKSGGNRNFWQVTPASRPALVRDARGILCARGDGSTSWMRSVSPLNWSTSAQATLATGFRRITATATSAFLMGRSGSDPRFYLVANMSARLGAAVTASVAPSTVTVVHQALAEVDKKYVMSARAKILVPELRVIVNNEAPQVSAASPGTGFLSGAEHFLFGIIGTQHANIDMYRAFAINRALTDAEDLAVRDWCNAPTQAY